MTGGLGPVLVAVGRRPRLWPTALAALVATARPGWWRRWPPAPLPSPAWLAFRLECATGDPGRPVPAPEVLSWLRWCRELRARAR